MKKHLPLVSGIILLLTIIFSITFEDQLHADKAADLILDAPKSSQQDNSYYTVVKVIDGDTFDIDKDGKTTRIRPIGINTPEMNDTRETVRCLARAAKDEAIKTLMNKKVRLEPDPTQADIDKYGRSLRYIFLEDGLFFNKYMIENGYAYEYTYNKPYKYTDEFNQAQSMAQESEIGLWSDEVCAE